MFMYLHCKSRIIIIIFKVFFLIKTRVYLVLSKVLCVCVELYAPCYWRCLCCWRFGPSSVRVMTSTPLPVVSLTEFLTSALIRASLTCVNDTVANVVSTTSSLKIAIFDEKIYFFEHLLHLCYTKVHEITGSSRV